MRVLFRNCVIEATKVEFNSPGVLTIFPAKPDESLIDVTVNFTVRPNGLTEEEPMSGGEKTEKARVILAQLASHGFVDLSNLKAVARNGRKMNE